MLVEEEAEAVARRNVLVGIRIDSHSRELLDWALVKVAEPGDCVIAVHVCRSSSALKDKPLLDDYLEVYEGLCSLKKVDLIGRVCTGISIQRTLVREARNHEAMAVVVGISSQSALRAWTSTAGYCAKQLPPTTDVLAIHNGKIVFGKCNSNQLPGFCEDPKPSVIECQLSDEVRTEFGDSEVDTDISSFEVLTIDGSEDSRDEVPCLPPSFANESKRRSTSHFRGDILDQRPGWPLLRRASSVRAETLQARELSVVQWAMNLPIRSSLKHPLGSFIERASEGERSDILEESSSNSSYASGELQNGLEILLKAHSSNCKWFSYEVLKTATSKFCSGNLIGMGGCNRVYKGTLPDGKLVAVKIRNSSEEAMKDFAQEVEIISSLNHKYITRLTGVCIKDFDLISVYDYISKGSLEEILHGNNKEKSALSWELRFSIAIKIAEALNYLHNECSRPVIHRDVKSSNILLSNEFEPQLSDFGLAIWGPTSSSFMIQGDVVGTFGYLAPEYFMYGKLSDKIDVYAFGVVILELLSGRKPIVYETPNGQESLVMWAKPIIESGNARGILDPSLDENFDEAQMRRMVLAANLCITRAARLRPKISEVLKLLRGDKDAATWVTLRNKDLDDPEKDLDDEVYPNSSPELHLNLALLDVDDDSTSFSSLEQGNILYMEEYLKERWSRSSSFN
ncbi:protein kinase STUNTED isoform X2 [Ricinus communis]|uniref:protein kinase STUNTED isoform X2 n=1 Tax=Ricinus communis TaxID=3988 RepID=UPI00201AF92F|nr:protein kinase STUNTED isoform X2 [Ricinus communis]